MELGMFMDSGCGKGTAMKKWKSDTTGMDANGCLYKLAAASTSGSAALGSDMQGQS